MKLRLIDAARDDLREAFDWYEGQTPSLGSIFLDQFEHAQRAFREYPNAWHPLGSGVRRCRLGQFPYGIIYVSRGDTSFVLAVLHERRRPKSWRKRLKSL